MQKVLVGLPIFYLVMAIALGDVTLPMLIIGSSIICTLGVGLVIWIPVFWLTGFITLAVLENIPFLAERLNLNQGQLVSTPPIQRDVIALSRYIRQSQQTGSSDSQIIHRLKDQGWTDADIEQAFRALSNPSSDR